MTSSPDERFLMKLAAALKREKIEAVVVGNTGSVLNGAAVMTNDVDLLVRDTPLNRRKLRLFAAALNGTGPAPVSELTNVERIHGAATPIDIIYDRISGNMTFASVRDRAHPEPIGSEVLLVASLEDIIKSKTAANREKDRFALPALRTALEVRKALGKP